MVSLGGACAITNVSSLDSIVCIAINGELMTFAGNFCLKISRHVMIATSFLPVNLPRILKNSSTQTLALVRHSSLHKNLRKQTHTQSLRVLGGEKIGY